MLCFCHITVLYLIIYNSMLSYAHHMMVCYSIIYYCVMLQHIMLLLNIVLHYITIK